MTYVPLVAANEAPRFIACLFALLLHHHHPPEGSLGLQTGGTTSCHAPVINFHAGRTMRRGR